MKLKVEFIPRKREIDVWKYPYEMRVYVVDKGIAPTSEIFKVYGDWHEVNSEEAEEIDIKGEHCNAPDCCKVFRGHKDELKAKLSEILQRIAHQLKFLQQTLEEVENAQTEKEIYVWDRKNKKFIHIQEPK